MNTPIHRVEVPFPQAFASRDQEARFRVPPGTAVSQGQPDLPEMVWRSNQTVRCDECASIQRRMKFSRCVLASRATLPNACALLAFYTVLTVDVKQAEHMFYKASISTACYKPLLSSSSFKARKLLLLLRRLVIYACHSASRPCFWYNRLTRTR